MQLSFHDLQQFNNDYLSSLSVTLLIQLCLKLLVDLKEAHDRLNQNPQNSSRPPSSQKIKGHPLGLICQENKRLYPPKFSGGIRI